MSINYLIYLDTPVSPAALRRWLVDVYGFEVSTGWHTQDGISWLTSKHGDALVEPPDPDQSGPYEYRQPKTVCLILDLNNRRGASEFLLRVAGDVVQHCIGDATMEYDVGGAVFIRRGETVWIRDEPFIREHLFAGDFRPAKLVIGLPPPGTDVNAEQ